MNLRTISSQQYTGDLNMAIDATMAEIVSARQQPVLRFYRWDHPTLTVGRTTADEKVQAASILFPDVDIVRRPTGGGILFHGDQMSLSLIWPRNKIPALKSLCESYCAIHKAIQRGLSDCGIITTQASEKQDASSVFCESAIVEGDLQSESGGKVLGGAQWRMAGAVLYQGHLWMRWFQPLEDAIAYHVAVLLDRKCEAGELSQEELSKARDCSEQWQVKHIDRN